MKHLTAVCASIALLTLSACDNTSQNIGSSLVQEDSEVVICNDFSVTGHSQLNRRIESRTITQLLGDIHAEGYGNFSSDFVCQFMPAVKLDTDGVTEENIDSIKLLLNYHNGAYVGDSIAPMGLEVYRLNRPLPTPIYSTFDPAEYCDLSEAPLGKTVYVGNALGRTDSIQALSFRSIEVKLPVQLARDLFTLYKNNPGAYALPTTFAKYFPGIYVRNSYGAGRVTQIENTLMVMYYHTDITDAEGKPAIKRYEGRYFTVTPEVVSNNNIKFVMSPQLQARINAGEEIIVAPVGRDVQLTFPITDVIDFYNANRGSISVVNTLAMQIPAEVIANDYGIEPPSSLLMVLEKDRDSFFLDNSLPDNKKSFLAEYNAGDHIYNFSSLREYLLELLNKYPDPTQIPAEEYTFCLTPVSLTTEQNSNGYQNSVYVSAVTPYIGKPAMVRLNLADAKITFQFSKQTLK